VDPQQEPPPSIPKSLHSQNTLLFLGGEIACDFDLWTDQEEIAIF